jgi:uncharacterized protein (TIGR03083 family)
VQPQAYLVHLRRELTAFEDCLAGDLSLPVRHCGDWTLHALADHLGRGNLWSAAAVTERRGDHPTDPAPRDPAALCGWFADTARILLAALDADPGTPAWTFSPPATVGFWQRRRCLETLVHRWDAQAALGRPGELEPRLAGDGVAEVLDVLAPRQVQRGRAPARSRAVRLVATDIGGHWLLGPGEPVATVRAPASDLLLLLWGRRGHDDPAIRWEGDRRAAAEVLRGPLVP